MLTIVERIESYIKDYASFENDAVALAVAVWTLATHCFETFDAFPYLVITSTVKRSGKTRLSELISNLACNPKNFSAMTPSTLFRVIDRQDIGYWEKGEEEFKVPTVVFDEAEQLGSESASTMRAVLNVGYRKGQKIPRTVGQKVIEFNTYCPKIFILIGDVYDTLRDRSIAIEMRRGEPRKRFSFETARHEASLIKTDFLADFIGKDGEETTTVKAIRKAYETNCIDFLQDREEEIWRGVFAVAKVLCPNRYRELTRIAVDLAAAKTAEAKKVQGTFIFDNAEVNEEYSLRLLKDLKTVINEDKNIFTEQAIEKLKALDLAPWRKFRGTGINAHMISDMLARFGVSPVTVRQGAVTAKGYKKDDVEEALSSL